MVWAARGAGMATWAVFLFLALNREPNAMMEQPDIYQTSYEKGPAWWFGFLRFLAIHLLCGVAFLIGFGWIDVAICAAMFAVRMFFVTSGYHRYFSHRTFKMGRVAQFIWAFMAMTSAQKGVLWWASHHRHHHKFSDEPNDVHSVRQGGFWWAHMGWIFHPAWDATDMARVKDFAKYPELVWLDKNKFVPPFVLALGCLLVGGWVGLFVWFLWSTVLLWHGTFTINSLAHVYGSRRYETSDDSRNNFLLALLTLGEGWHNNHHHYQASANQGFFWWEIDITYYVLVGLEKLGVVHDLRRPPAHVVNDRKHPVQQAIQSFTEAAARVREEALHSLSERADVLAARIDEANVRWDHARAEAHATWEQKRRTIDASIDELSERWDELVTTWSTNWDEDVEEIMARAEERLAEVQESLLAADRRARKAVDEMQAAYAAALEEIREAARAKYDELAEGALVPATA